MSHIYTYIYHLYIYTIYIYTNVTCLFSTADPKYNKQTHKLAVNFILSLTHTAEILGVCCNADQQHLLT